MMYRKVDINVGDRVCYRVAWLRSTGQMHSDIAHARGTVTDLRPFGGDREIATVAWQGGDFPARVLAQNLARVGTIAATSEDH